MFIFYARRSSTKNHGIIVTCGIFVLLTLLTDGVLDDLEKILFKNSVSKTTPFSESEDDDDDDDFYNQHRKGSKDTFPFRAVDAVVRTVLANLNSELRRTYSEVKEVTHWLVSRRTAVSIEKLDQLRLLKNNVAIQESKASMTRQAFEDILNDEDDMALMCFVQPPNVSNETSLTIGTEPSKSLETLLRLQVRQPLHFSKATAAPFSSTARPALVKVEDHEVFEVLFESHLQSVSTVLNSFDQMRTELTNGEQFHILRLTTARNKLLTASLVFTIIAMWTSIGSYVGSIFGMNLDSGVQEDSGWFNWVAIGTTVTITLGSMFVFLGLRHAGVLTSETGG